MVQSGNGTSNRHSINTPTQPLMSQLIVAGGRDDNLTRSERSLKFAKYGLVYKNKIRKIFKNLPNIDSFLKIYMDKFQKKNIDKFPKKIY